MPTIDADTHVIETERTWEFLAKSEQKYRPSALVASDPIIKAQDAAEERRRMRVREFWRIGKRLIPRRLFEVERTGTNLDTQELRSIEARLAHMDELGVDVQVLYPTLFLEPLTTEPEVEAALYRSYNRWMAETWEMGKKRLVWAALAPVMTMEVAVRELAWAKEHGACAVFMRSPEGNRILSDPYFYPLYAQASRLDLPICIHAGNGSFQIQDLYGPDAAVIARVKLSVIGAMHEIILSGLPTKFPDLRFGMIETSASWVPYICHDLRSRYARMFERTIELTDILRANRVYVACQTDDDLPHVLRYAGEDNLVIGSDYGHADTSSELEALRHLKQSGNVPAPVIDKILDDNARALYGLR